MVPKIMLEGGHAWVRATLDTRATAIAAGEAGSSSSGCTRVVGRGRRPLLGSRYS
jgi:hypothetical protein